jgi:phenylacetic acid degradation operon negative regulatory protein
MDAPALPARTAKLLAKLTPRSGPLIVTVFGDAIAPRGGGIWLGSLIALMRPLGLSERLVRTGIFRLTRDGWLARRSQGRRSYYEISEEARKTFAEAERRIYAANPPAWRGDWLLVQMLPGLAPARRQALRQALHWQGFGQLSPTLLARPGDGAEMLDQTLKTGKAVGRVAVFSARLEQLESAASPRTIAASAWDFRHLNEAYESFLAAFAPLANASPGDEVSCFVLRMLLIHEYRRILLQDPQLPPELLPSDWTGALARNLAANLYRACAPIADRFIDGYVHDRDGSPLKAEPSQTMRFGEDLRNKQLQSPSS